jgi:ABC-type lipoprotein export system ATPase subunit/predicted acetyltransferase
MPRFDIIKEITAGQSFKIEQVKSGFDLQTDHISEHFTGNIDIEGKDWNVGLIVGRSGTGKTTIAKEVFPDSYTPPHEYGQNAIIDEMPAGKSYKEITQMFTSVGFSSPPSWLKPYHVLSNGERMRVDLAYAILSDNDPILFDEFTSVVDRDIAKICAYAISKSIRKAGKKFIAVSCHEDIVDWLEPDWVYDTNSQTFTFRGYQRTRPAIKLDIYKCKNKAKGWNIFRKYHYLNTALNVAADCYMCFINDTPVAFCSILHLPHPVTKNIKKIHRLVVIPDYQGAGIGISFVNYIANIYKKRGFVVSLVTSQLNLTKSLIRHHWILTDSGHKTARSGALHAHSPSGKRVTSSFRYVGGR